MIAKRKRISCTVRLTEIHRGRFQVKAPGVVDMLTDVIEDGVNSENLSLCWSYQEAVCEQCALFMSSEGKASQVVACMTSLWRADIR